ncbi:MAG: hypothetical protein WC824_10920 [Bacteroidota bacterium]|jgi:hypothetical protein
MVDMLVFENMIRCEAGIRIVTDGVNYEILSYNTTSKVGTVKVTHSNREDTKVGEVFFFVQEKDSGEL